MRAAIKYLLKIVFTILSNVGIWGLGVRGALIFDDRAGELGVVIMGAGIAVRLAIGELGGWFAARDELVGVEKGFAGREDSLNRTLVIRFYDGILFLFEVMRLLSEYSSKCHANFKEGLCNLNSRMIWGKKH